jgi:beta-glucosidase
MIQASDFGEHFLWGVGMSAPQNEGAALEDGRGLSIWDVFSRRVTAISGGGKPTHASMFYYRYKDDLLLVKALGFRTFRFSISWSRVIPHGTGKVNQAGLQFYHALLDECLALGLTPMVTLYHWDLPQALQREGGWTNHQVVKWFNRYVKLCLQEFSGKVKYWIIMNEPFAFTALGYMTGMHAPGKIGPRSFYLAAHHAALATAEASRLIRSMDPYAIVGSSFSFSETQPYRPTKNDLAAAQKADLLLNRFFLEAALGMGFPMTDSFPVIEKFHLFNRTWRYRDAYQCDLDFIGFQNYFSVTVRNNPFVPYLGASEVSAQARRMPYTALGWEINPDSCYRMLHRIAAYPGVQRIIITEGGCAENEQLNQGKIEDTLRIHYFKQYLSAVYRAKSEGVPIDGYLVWTLTDNFEWAFGYSARFGLVRVDFPGQLRTIKESGYWFRAFLEGTCSIS